ncbi:MAG: phosphoglycerate dehydrogenase [Acidobacteria bacterium]|nr:phosphoglycerate dehydrogenase [Acidobacteriota bacterium]
MKIVVADKISERGLALLREPGWQVVRPAAGALAAELGDADGLVVRSATRVTAELLEHAPRLRVVGRAGVGVDNIDLEAATGCGVLVMNTPGGNAASVAEHTLALLLSLARSVPQLNAAIHAGRWEKSGATGIELRGKTLGLVGLGRVGSEVARRARALEMRVLAYDPYISENVAQETGVALVPLPELLARSDFVSLHTALSAATEKMINAESMGKMKRGARLINTARGELVDEAALAEALRSGHVAGAAVDVFAVEPPRGSPLVGLPNVIATPHIAGSTQEAQEEVGTQIAQQVRDYLLEGVMRNAVNLPTLSAEQYRRLRPYLDLAERLGSLVAQIAAGRAGMLGRIRIAYAGEPAEQGTHLLRNAVLAGVLNTVLDEKVNLVNAGTVAAARGLAVEERTRRREQGFPNTLEVTAARRLSETPGSSPSEGAREFAVEGTVLHGTSPRILSMDGIELEAPLEGTLLYFRNRDVPGVIGQVGTILGSHGINISTFALGRREPLRGAEAVALVRLDGDVPDSIVQPICGIAAMTEARLVRLPGTVGETVASQGLPAHGSTES